MCPFSFASMYRDHPRIRGEHSRQGKGSPFPAGSSPHTRGARSPRRMCSSPPGIIPAYAGSTTTANGCMAACWDHPRIRGEHNANLPFSPSSSGSSPHTRGAPCVRSHLRLCIGIIPAYAGSTPVREKEVHSLRDHPRIRGEHARTMSRVVMIPGSSPHTRGALVMEQLVVDDVGIIPAYAGSTSSGTRRSKNSRDHPRIRGEH